MQVDRLLRIYQYTQRYEAEWEFAWLQAESKAAELRKSEPVPQEEEAAGGLINITISSSSWLSACCSSNPCIVVVHAITLAVVGCMRWQMEK